MKYEIRVIKLEEENPEQTGNTFRGHIGGRFQESIFTGLMDSDQTIEILQHLHSLKERELDDLTPKTTN